MLGTCEETRMLECNLSLGINEKYILGDDKNGVYQILGKSIKEFFDE